MILDVITLERSPYSFADALAPEQIDLGAEDVKLKNAVKIKGVLTKRIAQIDVEGTIDADAELDCTRCLTPIEKHLEFLFNAAFVTEENYTAAKEAELKSDDLDISVFEGDKIDLAELVREQILLNLPEQVFCREDCSGLCEKCGANRNLIDCNCKDEEVDPRWAALKNLK